MKHNRFKLVILILMTCNSAFSQIIKNNEVTAWEVKEIIPTYLAGVPELNPMFWFGRQSQGAEGRIYPYPLFDTLTDEKKDKAYTMVYLENEFLKIGIAPELGGRIFSALDKTNNYNFFYKQTVIKPQLIGLLGAWISGGVEWNIPHHHRATTFMPVQYWIDADNDGSKTVWVGELELRHRMRWAVGYKLHPGKSYLELAIRIVNRTPEAQSMLCFANAAVHVNENYQVIFPPSTKFGTHHSKREFVEWPVAHSKYGGADFTEGIDISWYKNHYNANSVFAWNYTDDFFAGYDHGKEAGVISIADHHISPGKKFWTWGNGPRGRMWDKLLTDDDGPYIELMVGSYSDNQPDYSWLQPYETRSFSQFWYPFRGIGGVKNANLQAAVNLEVSGNKGRIGFCTTFAWPEANVKIKSGERTILDKKISIEPSHPFLAMFDLPEGTGKLDASLWAGDRLLVNYTPADRDPEPMPAHYSDPPDPSKIGTTEELYLAGLRIEQFHHPRLDAEPYWEEALRRDSLDVRVNTQMGIKALKQARYSDAEKFLRRSLLRLTHNYTSPMDGQSFYYLGQTLKQMGRYEDAIDCFYKATWSGAFRSQGYYGLAEISCKRNEFETALFLADLSTRFDGLNLRAHNLKAAMLRHLGNPEAALTELSDGSYQADPLDVRALAEKWLATENPETASILRSAMKAFPAVAQETASEYLNCGLWNDGTRVLELLSSQDSEYGSCNPMIYYYLAFFAERKGDHEKALDYCLFAERCPYSYVFPFQNEAIPVLENALAINPRDARASYYLGNLLFDWQPEKAIKMWEKSVAINPDFAIPWRNLAIAFSHRPDSNNLRKATELLEKAVSLPEKFSIHFTELDEFYEATGESPSKRLHLMENNFKIVSLRDDALSRLISLEVFSGSYEKAIQLMKDRKFEVWEGGTMNVADSWTDANVLLGFRQLSSGNPEKAAEYFEAAGKIPENLPSEIRGRTLRTTELNYLNGIALRKMKKEKEAVSLLKQAALDEKASGAQLFFRALAKKELGMDVWPADFEQLVREGDKILQESIPPGDQAPLKEHLDWRQNSALGNYLKGVGFSGLGKKADASEALKNMLKIKPDFLKTGLNIQEMGSANR